MRKILISGANSGIGLQIAHKELQEGNQLSIGIRDNQSIRGTIIDPQKWQEGQIIVNKYDALDSYTAKEWIRNTKNIFGGFDTLINCAGVLSRVPFLYKDNEREEVLKTMTINFLSVWELCKLSWENLSSSNKGRIITLVSMSGKRSKGDLAAYTSSKFALMGLCQTMRNKGWDHNIRVTAICPSWVNTKMASKVNSINKNEMSQPEDIAKICSMILKLPKQSVPFEIQVNCNLEI